MIESLLDALERLGKAGDRQVLVDDNTGAERFAAAHGAGIGIGDVAQIVHCLEHALARFGTQLLVLHVVDHVGDGGGGDACGFGHIAKRHALPGSCIQRYRLISLSRNLCD